MENENNFGTPIAEPNKYGIDLIMFRELDDYGSLSGWYMTTAPAYTVEYGDYCICEPRHVGRAFLIQTFNADETENVVRAIKLSGGMVYKLKMVMNVKWEEEK